MTQIAITAAMNEILHEEHGVRWVTIPSDERESIVHHTGLTEEQLFAMGLLAYLKDMMREFMQDILSILARYDVSSAQELEGKIRKGTVKEHPAWEDLIALENLDAKKREFENDIKRIQTSF